MINTIFFVNNVSLIKFLYSRKKADFFLRKWQNLFYTAAEIFWVWIKIEVSYLIIEHRKNEEISIFLTVGRFLKNKAIRTQLVMTKMAKKWLEIFVFF